MGQSSAIRRPLVSKSKAKARQVGKLAEIRESLVAAGYDTTAKQAAALGVPRPTAWAVLNRDKRVGPSSVIIKAFFRRQTFLPQREKIEEYVEEKIAGLYGHSGRSVRWFGRSIRFAKRNRPLRAGRWIVGKLEFKPSPAMKFILSGSQMPTAQPAEISRIAAPMPPPE